MGYTKCNEDDYERHVERLSSKGLNMSPDWTRFPTDVRQRKGADYAYGKRQ